MVTFPRAPFIRLPALLFAAAFAVAACGDDTTNPATPPDAGDAGRDGTTAEGGGEGGVEAGSDATAVDAGMEGGGDSPSVVDASQESGGDAGEAGLDAASDSEVDAIAD